MEGKKRKITERIAALFLAVVLVLSGVLPGVPVATVKAADTTTVTIKVVDSASPEKTLSGVTITIFKGDHVTDESPKVEPTEGKYILDKGEIYTYKLSGKQGYVEKTNTFTASSEDVSEQTLKMEMNNISISADDTALKVGETTTVSVASPVEGAGYTWQSSNTGVATVSNGTIQAVGEGTAEITASYNGKTSNGITISVTKIDTSMQLSADPIGGIDKNQVVLKIGNLPEDATGSIRFYVNGASEPAGQIDVARTREWTYENEDLRGNFTFRAKYEGDGKYNGCESNDVNANGFNRSQSIVFKDDDNSETAPKLVTLPTDEDTTESFNIELDNTSIIKNTVTYKSLNEDVLEVASNGTVTVKSSGAAVIKVTAEEGDNWIKAEKNYYVYVQKDYPFADIKSKISCDSLERIYNGSKEVKVTAKLSLDDLKLFAGDVDATKEFQLEITGELEKADAASYSEITIKDITKIKGFKTDGAEVDVTDRVKPRLKEFADKKIDANVTIKQRTVYLGTNAYETTYGKNVKTEIAKVEGLVKEAVSDEPDTGVVAGDTIDFSKFKATTANEIYHIGDHASTVGVNLGASSDAVAQYPNYTFATDENSFGTLTVKQATLTLEEILNNIHFTAEGGNLYQNPDYPENIWINGGTLKAVVGTDYAPYYSKVMLKNNATEIDLTATGYDVSNLETTKISGEIYLTNGTDACATTTFSFYVDTTAPEFKFGSWEGRTQVLDTWLGAITFNKYQKSYYTIEGVTHNDEVSATSDLAVAQSGVKEWGYHIYKVDSDEKLTKEVLQSYAKSVAWTAGSGDSIPVITAENGELEEVQGNYIVLVKVTDKVGNSAVYSTNGVIFDVTDPTITILNKDGTAIDSTHYYKADVEYKVELKDTDTTSGFASATIRIVDGETEKAKEEITFNGNDSYTLEEIQNLAVKSLERTIPAGYDSNNLKIEVTAIDQAGNMKKTEQALMIDSTIPEINVEFNNDSDVKNGKYFKTDRIMTITYTEKNIDKENGITFDVDAGIGINEETADKNMKLSQLENYGISYAWISDSEADKTVSEVTNERKNTLVLTFDRDNEYYIVPHCTDLAGNTEEVTYANDTEYAKNFVVDKTAPTVEVTYDLAGGVSSDSNNRTYTSETVKATVKITELNFWKVLGESKEFSQEPKQMNFGTTKGTEPNEEQGTLTNYQKEAENVDNWSLNGTTAQTVFTFEKDANYTFGFTFTDLAGNEFVYSPTYFTVDKTQPTGTIAIDEQSVWDVIWNVITFNIFKNDTYDIVLTSDDITAGVKSTAYYKTAKPLESAAEVEALGEEAWTEGTGFTVSPNEQFVVYARIIDKANNVRFLFPKNGAVADDVKPTIEVKNLSTARNGIYSADVKFSVSVKDPTAGDTYSGLEKVWYTINAAGNVTASEETILVDNSANRVQGNQEWSGNFTVSAQKYNSNDVKVQVHALDFSGNEYETEIIPLKIDITKPEVAITFDEDTPLNGKYYKNTRVATVSVTERNFDPNAVRFNITNTDGTQATISGWSISAQAGVGDEAVNTCRVTFAADGDYTFAFDCTDLAGNLSNMARTEDFTVDQTVPIINVAFDNNNAQNGTYYNAPRTATITVVEHNFNGSEVQAAINASLQSQGITTPGVNGWSTSGDSHSATINFGNDGDYSFTVNYSDLAGNAAQEVAVSQFTIDQTKPVIEIFDIVDRSANNGTVAPGVNYSDVNYDAENVSITIKGSKHEEKAVDGARTSIPNGQSIKMEDFAHEEAVDDVYTLTAKVTDRAGNSEEQSVLFSVNRFGSNFVFSDATDKFLTDYYSNKEQDLVVTEINVDTLEHQGISYGRDGKHVTLEEGKDYSVKESGNEVSWKSYEYRINAENFEEEGLYNVTIDSKDRATNEVNNKIKEADIEFVIDKTKPTVVITGIENAAQYKANERDIAVVVSDNVTMGDVDIYVDGSKTPVESFDAEMIQKQRGELPYTLGSSSDWQNVTAVAVDAAGNRAESSDYRVLITSNILIQYYRNTPLFVGSIVVVLAAAGSAFFFGKKRKKIRG